jgi:hypothetical protein
MVLGEYPDHVPEEHLIPPSAFASDADIGRFIDVAGGAGVDVIGLSGGVVLDDFDQDGYIDIMVTDWGVDRQMRMFINQVDGTFRESTKAAGLEGEVGGLNMIHADYDNDGRVDVLVLRGAWLGDAGRYPKSLLRNRGAGRFDDVTEQAGILSLSPTQTAVWMDYNRDGWLDLFVGNETVGASQRSPCQLFQNQGNGTFIDVAPQVGLDIVGPVKGATSADIDNDGLPDLYLSLIGATNRMFHNEGLHEGGWRFKDVTRQAGVGMPIGSFPTWFWDFDNDGWEDLLVAPFAGFRFDGQSLSFVVADMLGQNPQADRLHLYRNTRDGRFVNVAPAMNLDRPMLVMGANFGDLDNDGFLDCYFGTGDPHYSTLIPNRMFRNHLGQRFQDVTTSGGFGHLQKGHGIAFADLDNDGDQDIYAVMGGAFSGDWYQKLLFQNPGHSNHWVTLRLQGKRANRAGMGARIKVSVRQPSGTIRTIHVTAGSGGSFGASSLQQEIGLGDAQVIESIEIRWPIADSIQTIHDVPMDAIYIVREGEPQLERVELKQFELRSADHHHHHHHVPTP